MEMLSCRTSRGRRSSLSIVANETYFFVNQSHEAVEAENESCGALALVLDLSHLYYVPCLILLGGIGNLLSCVVFLNTHLKMRSSSYYLAALAATDFSFLLNLALVWLRMFNKAYWCQLITYISGVSSSLSVWLIVAFTVERFIAVQYPLHRPHMCTISRAKTIVLVLSVIALASNSYIFVTAGLARNPEGLEVCALKPEYTESMKYITIVDTVVSLLAPLVLIVVMNTMIMNTMVRFGRTFRRQESSDLSMARYPSSKRSELHLEQTSNGNSNSNNDANAMTSNSGNGEKRANSHFTQSFNSSKSNRSSSQHQSQLSAPSASAQRNIYRVPETLGRGIHIRSSSKNLGSTRNQQSITNMLLLISTVFCLLNLPSYVIRLCLYFYNITIGEPPTLLWCLQQLFMLLYYTNFSINFLLYSMCGITFRRCLEQLLRKVCKSITRNHCNPQRYT